MQHLLTPWTRLFVAIVLLGAFCATMAAIVANSTPARASQDCLPNMDVSTDDTEDSARAGADPCEEPEPKNLVDNPRNNQNNNTTKDGE